MKPSDQNGTCRELSFEAIVENEEYEWDYLISLEVYETFLAAFHDINPIHVDEDYAKKKGFPGKVMHGAILNGFLSHFIGTQFPGVHSLILSVDMRFHQPSHLCDTIRLKARVVLKSKATQTLQLTVLLENLTRQRLAASAKIQVKVCA